MTKRDASTPQDPLLASLRATPTAYSSIRPYLRSFDMIAFRAPVFFSNLISFAEYLVNGKGASTYTHCGVVIMGIDFPQNSPYYISVADSRP